MWRGAGNGLSLPFLCGRTTFSRGGSASLTAISSAQRQSPVTAVIVALVVNEFTGGGATLVYGATLLFFEWAGQPGCEATVLPNLILRRNDQIGCPTFSPVDRLEARLRGRDAPATVKL